jgi:membrane protease YdiL (CAAX protease family)
MEEINSGKDTSIEKKRPSRFSALSHLFIGSGVFILSISIFTAIAWMAFGFKIEDLEGADLFVLFKDNSIGLKIFTFFSSSLPLIVAALVITMLIRASSKDYLLLHKPANLKWFLLAIVFIFISIPLMSPLLQLNELIDFNKWPDLHSWLLNQENANNKLYEAMLGEKSTTSFLTSILFMALMPAIAEEIFFRGFLMNAFNGLFKNMHVAIILTALFFSIIHMQFMKVIPMFFMAVIFGYAVYWTRSIWTSIIAHFLNNSLAVFQLYFITDGDYNEALSQGASLPILAVVLLSVASISLFYYIQKNSNTKTENFYV